MVKTLKDIRVLVVEDEPALNQAYVTILESEHIAVESCFNGEEALAKISVHKPDVILLDLRMPKMDGIEFLRKFSTTKYAKNTKVVIFSNYDEQKEIDSAFSLGATRYMLKAWTSPKELLSLIRETVATA
jgi:CheY-like chemotaxis protein